MSTATVLTSAMAGMPVLNGTEGSLAAVIRYIAPTLGWSIEFDSGGPIIVIRPQSYKGGQALLYRFDDRAARGGAAPRAAEVRAYESMSDINTGAGLVGPAYVHKSFYATTASKRYYVIGDQFGFYLGANSLRAVDPAALAPHYLGFLNGAISDDLPKCVLFGQPDDEAKMSNFFYANEAVTENVANLYLSRNRSGRLNIPCAMITGGGFQCGSCGIGSLYNSSGTSLALPAYPYNGQALLSRPFVNDGSKSSISGYLPGLYAWHHSNKGNLPSLSHNDYATVDPVAIDGKAFVTAWAWNLDTAPKDSAAGVVFDISEGFRP